MDNYIGTLEWMDRVITVPKELDCLTTAFWIQNATPGLTPGLFSTDFGLQKPGKSKFCFLCQGFGFDKQ